MNAAADYANDDLDFELEITKVTRRASGAGTWVCGKIDDYRFDALVFPEHAENREWEIGDSRISKLWLSDTATRATAFNWDRGLDVPATNPTVQAAVDFLCGGLAEVVYEE